MTEARHINKAELRMLAKATRTLIGAAGGLQEAADEVRVQTSVLSGYQNPHSPRWMPADVEADLERHTGELALLRALAAIQGHYLLPLNIDGSTDMTRSISELGKECGDVFGCHADALADESPGGAQITADEADQIADELDDVIRKAGIMADRLRRDPKYRTVVTSSGVALVAE